MVKFPPDIKNHLSIMDKFTPKNTRLKIILHSMIMIVRRF
jgi:hypothetical protein